MATALENEDKLVKETLHLIDQGSRQLSSKLSNHGKPNLIFVLGNTGGGKTTTVEIVTGNLARLQAKRCRIGYVIVDEVDEGSGTPQGRIGDPQVASKTKFPEYLSCNDSTGQPFVFVDCPGFNDNRGAHVDIAAMVLIQKIASQLEYARFLFVVPSSSLSLSNLNRTDFLLLATHATSFLKNLKKAKDSIGLVITKVNNFDPTSKEKIEDQTVIDEVTDFLLQASNEPAFKKNQQFIDCLLDNADKWILIRYPTESGPLNTMEQFVKVQQQSMEMCTTKLKPVAVTTEDFATPLSSESENVIIKRLIPHMKKEIGRILPEFVEQIQNGFITKFQAELLVLRGEKLVAAVKNLDEICTNFSRQNHGQDCMLPVTKKIVDAMEWLQISFTEDIMVQLKKTEEELHIFQQLTGEADVEKGISLKIISLFDSIKAKLIELHKSTLKILKHNNVQTLVAQIKVEIQEILLQFKGKYTSEFWNSLTTGDEFGKEALGKLETHWLKLETLEWDNFGTVQGEKISAAAALNQIWIELELDVMQASYMHLEELENELDMLLALTGEEGGSTSYGNPSSILTEVCTAVKSLRTESQAKVRGEYVKLVHGKIQELVDTQFGNLEEIYFRGKFYPLNLDNLGEKRETLEACNKKLQNLLGNINVILDGVVQGFKIFEIKVPQTDQALLGKYETLLSFYDGILGSCVPRPINDWMTRLKSLHDRIQEMEPLYEFMDQAKKTNPVGIGQDLLSADGDISGFLEVFRASSYIRHMLEQARYVEEKLLIFKIATFLEKERAKLEPKADSATSSVNSITTTPSNEPWISQKSINTFFDAVSKGLEYMKTSVEQDDGKYYVPPGGNMVTNSQGGSASRGFFEEDYVRNSLRSVRGDIMDTRRNGTNGESRRGESLHDEEKSGEGEVGSMFSSRRGRESLDIRRGRTWEDERGTWRDEGTRTRGEGRIGGISGLMGEGGFGTGGLGSVVASRTVGRTRGERGRGGEGWSSEGRVGNFNTGTLGSSYISGASVGSQAVRARGGAWGGGGTRYQEGLASILGTRGEGGGRDAGLFESGFAAAGRGERRDREQTESTCSQQ